jgi:hypothetical protein
LKVTDQYVTMLYIQTKLKYRFTLQHTQYSQLSRTTLCRPIPSQEIGT